jgi:hypothetical protein
MACLLLGRRAFGLTPSVPMAWILPDVLPDVSEDVTPMVPFLPDVLALFKSNKLHYFLKCLNVW